MVFTTQRLAVLSGCAEPTEPPDSFGSFTEPRNPRGPESPKGRRSPEGLERFTIREPHGARRAWRRCPKSPGKRFFFSGPDKPSQKTHFCDKIFFKTNPFWCFHVGDPFPGHFEESEAPRKKRDQRPKETREPCEPSEKENPKSQI